MNDRASDFLTAVLGATGAQVLRRASEREPALGPLLVPRAALAWVAGHRGYEGQIPGVENSYLRFQKSETGLTGVISFGELNYSFEAVTPEHLAAATSAAVGVELRGRREVRDAVLIRLGKSIDALVEAQALTKAVARAVTSKAEPPGQTHAPSATGVPEAPSAPQKQPRTKKPRLPKLPGITVGKSEAQRPCGACGGQQFDGQQFRGCLCFRDLKKYVDLTTYGDGYVLEFRPGADRDLVTELRKTFCD